MIRCCIVATLVALAVATASAQTPARIQFKSIVVGKDFTCGIDATGQPYCWGAINKSLVPKAVDTPERFTQLAAGESHVCGVSDQEAVWCWGSGTDGQLGDSVPDTNLRRLVAANAKQVAVGDKFSCVLDTSGSVHCWGYGIPEADRTLGRIEYAQISAGTTELCALQDDGEIGCWSWRNIRRVGPDFKSADAFEKFATSDHSCGLLKTGDAYCWGSGPSGELGGISNPGTVERTPQPVINRGTFHDIAVAPGTTCGIRNDRTVLCWGKAQAVTGDRKINLLALGAKHSCAIDVAGAAICWGDNSAGQLGDGSTEPSEKPRVVGASPSLLERLRKNPIALYGGLAALVLVAILLLRRRSPPTRPGPPVKRTPPKTPIPPRPPTAQPPTGARKTS